MSRLLDDYDKNLKSFLKNLKKKGGGVALQCCHAGFLFYQGYATNIKKNNNDNKHNQVLIIEKNISSMQKHNL